jgi:hypothetical protein
VSTETAPCHVPGAAVAASDPSLINVGVPVALAGQTNVAASTFKVENSNNPGLATLFQNFQDSGTSIVWPTPPTNAGWTGKKTDGTAGGAGYDINVRTSRTLKATDNTQVLVFQPSVVAGPLGTVANSQVYDFQFTLTVYNSWGASSADRIAVITEGEDITTKPDLSTACASCPAYTSGSFLVRMNRSFSTVANPPFTPSYRDGPTQLDSGTAAAFENTNNAWAETDFNDSRSFGDVISGSTRPGFQGATLTTMAALQDSESATDGTLKDSVYRIVIPEIVVAAGATNSFKIYIFSPGATNHASHRNWSIDNVVFQPRRSISQCGIQYAFRDSANQESRYCLRFLAPWTCLYQNQCSVLPTPDTGSRGFFAPLGLDPVTPTQFQSCP